MTAASAASSPEIPLLSGLSEVAEAYDGFILDLWGVLHDGVNALPGVTETLRQLRRTGKRVLLLSNAPRRCHAVVARLEEMGLSADLYDQVLTSGEATHQALRDRTDPWHAALGRRCLHLGPPRDASVFEGLDLALVGTPDAADFVVNTGIDDFDETLDDHEPMLRACAARRLPMVCANPDLVVHVGPKLAICAGMLARRYEELGGTVFYHGKPHPPIYRRCLDLLGIADRRRVVAVGDSLRTDIAGARAAGLDSLLITGGIHRDELGIAWGEVPDPRRLAELVAASGERPTAALARLVW